MKKLLTILLLSTATMAATFAQTDKTILYSAADVLHGVGKYNGLGFGAGLNARLQYPIRQNLALTAKVGAEYYRISTYSYNLGFTHLTYGYNYATGWGFNTPMYGGVVGYPTETHGFSLPVTVGPRLYLPPVLEGLHTDLNLGLDIAASKTMRTSLRFEPGVGYTLPLPGGRYLDITASLVTTFKRGDGVVGVSVAYGLPANF
ncbi:hypothetical protein [Salmonirosea aquatica]|uniref:Outer membrane beta-barrel protein n=1 Tax=Salmonirosea aquatica TaxID=2654236 RepID=A0A7C9BHT5_9BACT|nr:hypothetical protein [Cytophagaceae bacterium SJW1-29]